MSQPPPPPPPGTPGSTVFLLSALGRQVREQLEGALHEHGLSLRTLSALGHLSREPGASYSELARRARVTAQSMQATLRGLEEAGAVERRTAPGRGRTAELHLTPAGHDLLRRGHGAVADAERRQLAALSPADRRTLATLLARAFHPQP